MNLKEAAAKQKAAQERADRAAEEAKEMAKFRAKERELIGDLPPAFFNMVSSMAWEYGHACGLHEVLAYVEDIGEQVRRALKSN